MRPINGIKVLLMTTEDRYKEYVMRHHAANGILNFHEQAASKTTAMDSCAASREETKDIQKVSEIQHDL